MVITNNPNDWSIHGSIISFRRRREQGEKHYQWVHRCTDGGLHEVLQLLTTLIYGCNANVSIYEILMEWNVCIHLFIIVFVNQMHIRKQLYIVSLLVCIYRKDIYVSMNVCKKYLCIYICISVDIYILMNERNTCKYE